MSKAGKPRRSILSIEPLESREVPATTASLNGATLVVDSTNGNDSIIVRQQSGKVSIDGAKIRDRWQMVASADQARVRQVVIHALAGDDTINVGTLTIPAMIWGGAGNDLVYCGSGNDTVYGDQGNDTVYGGPGNDWLVGGDGNDLIYGGPGNDWISGDAGDDFLSGGSGNDTINGGDGRDRLSGGSGSDVLDGHGFGIGSAYADKNFDTFQDEFDLWRPIPLELRMATSLPVLQKGQLENTSFLAPLGALSPADIKASIRVIAKGIYDVTLRGDRRTIRVNFDGTWTDNDPKPMPGNDLGFAAILLSRARLMSFGIDPNQYHSKADWDTLNTRSGNRLYSATDALHQFTGRTVSTISPYRADFWSLKNQLEQGRAIVAYSYRAALHTPNAAGVSGDTNYVVRRLFVDNRGVHWIELYNPLGVDTSTGRLVDNAPGAVKQNDGLITVTWDDFRKWSNFTALYTA